MSEKWRQTAIHDKISRALAQPNVLQRHEFSWKLLCGIFLYSLLLTVPFIWVNTPADIFIGATSRSDLISRVDFYWQKPDRVKIEHDVMAGHYPLYSERPRGEWVEDVFAPIVTVLEHAADNSGIDVLIARAAKGGMILDAAAAKTICDYVNREMRGGLYSAIINPAKQALYEWVYRHGIIAEDRYNEEMKGGRHFIEIINSGENASRGRLAEIGEDVVNAPVSSQKAGQLVKKGIYDHLFAMRPDMRTVMIDLLTSRVMTRPTLVYQAALTQARLDARLEHELRRSSHVLKNSLLIAKGQEVKVEDFTKIVAENQTWLQARGWQAFFGRLAGKLLLIFFVCVFFTALFFFLVPVRHRNRLRGVALVTLPVFILMFACLRQGIALNILPLGVISGMVALGCGATLGIFTTAFCALIIILLDVQQFDAVIGFFISGCFFAWLAPLQRFRMGLAKIAFGSAFAAVLVTVAWTVSEGQSLEWPLFSRLSTYLLDAGEPVVRALWSVGGWILSLIVILLSMRLLRPLFGVSGNVVLQDFQEHPLLTRMLTEAPSTYFHCSVTAALAEAAARAIGVNPVVCRIASLYHDVGKLTKPEYFTENEKGISRHDALSPYMSNLIIIGHVKDGAEIARQSHLPPEISEIIEQHHGTTQVGYFLRRAKEEAAEKHTKTVDENLFRYPGPKPQSPEAAVIMLADSVEAASRSLVNATPARIRELVGKIIASKLNDRQLDACGLNFTDLARITDALVLMLTSMFHSRVSYDKKQ